jgi:hypothetical protein
MLEKKAFPYMPLPLDTGTISNVVKWNVIADISLLPEECQGSRAGSLVLYLLYNAYKR